MNHVCTVGHITPWTRNALDSGEIGRSVCSCPRGSEGFQKITFFGDEAAGDYGSFSLWESKEDAEAEAEAIRPQLEQAVSGIAKEPPTRRLFEVYEPKAQINFEATP